MLYNLFASTIQQIYRIISEDERTRFYGLYFLFVWGFKCGGVGFI